MILSIDESLKHFRRERINPEWNHDPDRIAALKGAFACLLQRFKTRKGIHAILSMGSAMLNHVAIQGSKAPKETVDFFKEAITCVVELYEHSKFDPEKEEAIFMSVYAKFSVLKEQIKAEITLAPMEAEPHAASVSSGAARSATAEGQRLNAVEAASEPLDNDSAPATSSVAEVRKFLIGRKSLAIDESSVALVRPLAPKKRQVYLKNSNVPLKDFNSLLKGLAKQFKGNLAAIKNGKLKQLTLPVMVPYGIGLPQLPDTQATTLMVISNGNWNGVLFCSRVAEQPVPLASFKKSKNGDILGVAHTSDNEDLYLLNVLSLLKRDGFLTMV